MKYIIIAFSSFIWISNAYAYLDPGTGSLVIQSVIAAITGGLFILKTYWYKIKAKLFFKRQKIEDENDSQ
ncbi:hypothetical protein [Legionella longbeachae]|uniref:hypothetical protein n=1 Tax=Legionella longbeachae TaxID=450 RepID=UPI001246BE58|nr:hypothetical protein [Legionella longbeachae]QEY50095.1 hypothetical protein FQU71_01880 [Legionella longbeachae]QEY50225.1 hypothetical protein FQU71_02585 [Legionella longbeachae]